MENIKPIEQLLSHIYKINEHYEEISKISGENFNIFNILKLTSDEVSHTKFIAMLINPEGEHCMNNLFLDLFLKTINIDESKMYDFSNAEVKTEYSFGNGQIDILIKTNKKKIIIENKIYAKDQDEQLKRYHDYDENAILLYLTLNGHEPSENSTGGNTLIKNKDYFCISYKDHILFWLESCIKETIKYPFLRETINQYILLIKQLTNQTRSKQMKNELIDLITKSDENFKAYSFLIDLKREDIYENILKNKVVPELKRIAQNYQLIFNICNDKKNILMYDYGFSFNKQEWNEISIEFYFNNNLSNLVYFIWNRSKGENSFKDALKNAKKMEKYNHWNRDVFINFYSNNDVTNEIENKIKELIQEIEKQIV